MREKFTEHRFNNQSEVLITVCDKIVSDYLSQDLRLTLRQLYYVLVSRNVIPNADRPYKNLGNLISDARLAGRIDWEAIEDRIRVPVHPPEFKNLQELVDAALQSYRLPRWTGQKHYVELWVEKDALAGILRPLALRYHVTLLVNRGYGSTSAMYDAYNRFAEKDAQGYDCVLFYLGDFDPSGEDMVRDIRARLNDVFGIDVTVEKLALTLAQVQQYNLPPNPAKHTDPRSQEFIRRHGASSWEVDALPPEVLNRIIHKAFSNIIDAEEMKSMIKKEDRDKTALLKALAGLADE